MSWVGKIERISQSKTKAKKCGLNEYVLFQIHYWPIQLCSGFLLAALSLCLSISPLYLSLSLSISVSPLYLSLSLYLPSISLPLPNLTYPDLKNACLPTCPSSSMPAHLPLSLPPLSFQIRNSHFLCWMNFCIP